MRPIAVQSEGRRERDKHVVNGVKFIPNFVTWVEENLKNTFGLNLTWHIAKSTLHRGVFSHAIACGHHSKCADQFCIRSCQKLFLFEYARYKDEEPVRLRGEEPFSD